MGRPIFFVQKRVGKNSKIFKIFKFRTMNLLDESKNERADINRTTRLGKVLRRFSLDEIPQIFNIFI